MMLGLQITFRNMPASPAVEANIRERAGKLDSFYDRIMSCRVVVEAPHRHHNKGKLYHVRIDMTVPGGELVVNREPSKHTAHKDVYMAIRDAFNAARRQLQNYVRCQRKKPVSPLRTGRQPICSATSAGPPWGATTVGPGSPACRS